MTGAPENPPPTWHDMGRDVDLALALAQGRPTGPAADEVRRRLRSYLTLLADPAEAHARSLADSHARDLASATVDHARALLRDDHSAADPAALLRSLAKSTRYLMRYAARGHQQSRNRDHAGR
ncbi:DUF6415 family natural product biosynthesis protein [Streptomyces alkaliterrae]|uniref:SAV-6107-like HEPN domain-containing protein n=1 Tax=Streptomyces alkaliterrae TaxID=2213162 RepID=A0A5P0YTC1_9ACTN|nr:DUF6415 family natural product biosynthesis protein [Streptomyces alkaliterrae]MBB1259352.1 hypothetical protein [Streptomyces alkaliterrae]MQS01729.1 hypothetical protein [Streptomyces alkaliterrae]